MKYIVVYISGVASRIAKETEIPGYTQGILEPFFPDKKDLAKFSKKQSDQWIKENNKLLEDVCRLMNENNL